MADKAIAVHRIKHDGTVFEPGEVVQGVKKDVLNHLVDAGAVEIIKTETSAAKKKRARTDEGHFVPDDPTTPDVNEAWSSPPKPKKKAPTKKKS
jgi:hypothetical protein